LKRLYLQLDLISDKQAKLYIYNEDNIPLSKIIILKSNEEQINLDILTRTKYMKELYFIHDNYYFKRKIIIDIQEKIIYKYEDIEINEEKIRQDITKSSSKDDNRKTLFFGQKKFLNKAKLYEMLEKFNKHNIDFSKTINDIITNKKVNCKDILKSMKSLSEEQTKISEYLN